MNKIKTVVAVILALAAVASAHADDYPNAPIHLVSGFPAGSTADISARVVGAKMGQMLGQQFVIENRLGASSSLAGAAVARAPKDGYTLFVSSAANMINAAMSSNVPFDVMKDFAPITLITSTPTVLVVTPELGVKSVEELIAAAKAKPGAILFGSSGTGSSTHLALELFKSLAHVDIQHVPYTGSPQVVTDLLANRIHGYFSPASTVSGQIAAGKLVALAVTDAQRSSFFPSLPTMTEAGVQGCVSVLWFGISAPVGTPQPIVDRLSKAANEALKDPEVKKAMNAQTVELHGGSPATFRAFMDEEEKRWNGVVEHAHLRK